MSDDVKFGPPLSSRVVITDVHIPFWTMVTLLVKAFFAAIIAGLVVMAVVATLWGGLAAFVLALSLAFG